MSLHCLGHGALVTGNKVIAKGYSSAIGLDLWFSVRINVRLRVIFVSEPINALSHLGQNCLEPYIYIYIYIYKHTRRHTHTHSLISLGICGQRYVT